MIINEDKRIIVKVPFLKDKSVLYVSGLTGLSPQEMEFWKNDVAWRLEEVGFKLIYVPDLLDRLSPDIVRYVFPGMTVYVPSEAVYRNIRNVACTGDKSGFIYKVKGRTYFRPIPDFPSNFKAFDDFIDFLENLPKPEEPGNILFREAQPKAEPKPKPKTEKEPSELKSRKAVPDKKAAPKPDEPRKTPRISFSMVREEERLNPHAQDIVDALDSIKRDYNVTTEELYTILDYQTKLSRLWITPANKIFLPDWDGSPEVKLDDLTKALYFFYLRNPAGASVKELPDHRDEILDIYAGISGREMEAMEKSVDILLDPYDNGHNVRFSRIKKAFRDIVGDHIAKNYYVDGPYGGTRKIRLDRNLVVWG